MKNESKTEKRKLVKNLGQRINKFEKDIKKGKMINLSVNDAQERLEEQVMQAVKDAYLKIQIVDGKKEG